MTLLCIPNICTHYMLYIPNIYIYIYIYIYIQPRAPCVMAELVDDPHRHGDEEEDGEKGGGGVGKRGRGRGRPAVGDGAGGGRGGAEGEREEDPLVFCPLLKYEGSGRLLDMAPDAQFEEGGAESSAGAAGLKVMRAPCAFRVSYSRFQRWLQILAWSIETVCILCLPRLLTSYARAHARTHAHTHVCRRTKLLLAC